MFTTDSIPGIPRATVRRLLLIVPVFVATLWLAFALRRTWLETKAAHPEINLADGTILRVEGLTWGSYQTLRVEPAWWSEVKRRLPPAWQARIGVPQAARQIYGDPAARLWLSHLSPTTGAYLPGVPGGFAHFAADGSEFRFSGGMGYGSGRAAIPAACADSTDWTGWFLQPLQPTSAAGSTSTTMTMTLVR